MDKLEFVTYCGLYCGLCSARCRTPRHAAVLRDSMAKDDWQGWGQEIPGFKPFWEFLNQLAEKGCPGCRQGGGPPFCGIRKCARKRETDICPFCNEFPCHRIEALAQGYPTLIPDGNRMKSIGIDAWIEEQKQREKTGFAYVDIRCHPYHVPEE